MNLSPSNVDDVHKLALEHVTPFVRWGGEARVDRSLIKLLSRLGLVAPFFATEFGGSGDGLVSATLLCSYREGLARVSPEASTALATQIGGIFVVARHASEAIRREWIPRVVAGEAVTAIALTEPDRGSDAASMTMPATRTAGGWRLSGKKVWIMKAPDADLYTVFARTSGITGPHGITAFLVPKEAPGLTGVAIDALWPDRVGNLSFEDVFVADSHVIGQVDAGFKLGMGVFDAFRPSVGAHMLGLAQIALKHSIRYAKERHAFGQPIARYQAVSHPLAEMATRMEAARLLTYEAARVYDQGDAERPRSVSASASAMAKLFSTEMAQYVVDQAMQIHGAVGLERGHVIEHLYREVRPSRIYEGTSEIQREIISRSLMASEP